MFGESAVHLTLEGLGTVSVQELGRSVREALNIADSAQDVFAFWLCSPLLGENFVLHTYNKGQQSYVGLSENVLFMPVSAQPILSRKCVCICKLKQVKICIYYCLYSVKLMTVTFSSSSLFRFAVKDKTSAIQAVPSVAGPVVSLHRCLWRRHFTRWEARHCWVHWQIQ